MNTTACPRCGRAVAETAPACPNCGEKIFVEHPADIRPIRHRVMTYPDEKQTPPRKNDGNQAD